MELLLDDPVARREIAGISRRRRTYVLRAVYVGLLGALLWLIWTGQAGGRALNRSEFADVGRRLFRGFYLFQMAFLALAPAATAFELFYREIRTGAVDLLLLTPRSSLSLTLGKWKAAMAEAAGYVLCGVPVLAACAFLGAVGIWEIAWAAATSLLQAGLAAAIAIHYAARLRTSAPRLGDAIATVCFWQFAPVLTFVTAQLGMVGSGLFHPLYAGLWALYDFDALFGLGPYVWLGNLVLGPALIRHLLAEAARQDVRLVPAATAATARPRLPRRPAEVSERRPLLWKELRLREAGWAASGQRGMMLTAIAALAFVSWAATQGHGLAGFAFVGGPMLTVALFNGAFLFHQEEDRRRWDLLLSTPLTPGRIVGTKLLAGLVAPEARFLLALLAAAVVGWGYSLPWSSFVLFAGVVALFTAFVYLLSAASALLLKSRTSGGFLAAGLLFVLLAVLPWMRVVGEGRGAEGLRRLLDAAYLSLHPAALLAPLAGLSEERGRAAPFFAVYATAAALLVPLMVRHVARLAR